MGYYCENDGCNVFRSTGSTEAFGYDPWSLRKPKNTNNKILIVPGFIVIAAMFTIATAFIAKYSQTFSKAYAASSVVFLFLYIFA